MKTSRKTLVATTQMAEWERAAPLTFRPPCGGLVLHQLPEFHLPFAPQVSSRKLLQNAPEKALFGNPRRIITDRGTAFTSGLLTSNREGIQFLHITTGVPRNNGLVERIHKIVIPMLSKMGQENPLNWYCHVDRVQQIINNTPPFWPL